MHANTGLLKLYDLTINYLCIDPCTGGHHSSPQVILILNIITLVKLKSSFFLFTQHTLLILVCSKSDVRILTSYDIECKSFWITEKTYQPFNNIASALYLLHRYYILLPKFEISLTQPRQTRHSSQQQSPTPTEYSAVFLLAAHTDWANTYSVYVTEQQSHNSFCGVAKLSEWGKLYCPARGQGIQLWLTDKVAGLSKHGCLSVPWSNRAYLEKISAIKQKFQRAKYSFSVTSLMSLTELYYVQL